MSSARQITKTPWDSIALGIDTYEIHSASKKTLQAALKKPGHYTVKIRPLSSKKTLHDYGFYYCDTLIVPFCPVDCFMYFQNRAISVSDSARISDLIRIASDAFHGRFHRDFHVDKKLADLRYVNWLKEFYKTGQLLALKYNNELAGFFALSKNRIRLHAMDKKFRGKGLAKYLWSAACRELFNKGYPELESSISVSNIAALNLYRSLGFKFRNPLDVYHRLVVKPSS